MFGDAALTRRCADEDCLKAYAVGRDAYSSDACDGLGLMDKIGSGRFDNHLAR